MNIQKISREIFILSIITGFFVVFLHYWAFLFIAIMWVFFKVLKKLLTYMQKRRFENLKLFHETAVIFRKRRNYPPKTPKNVICTMPLSLLSFIAAQVVVASKAYPDISIVPIYIFAAIQIIWFIVFYITNVLYRKKYTAKDQIKYYRVVLEFKWMEYINRMVPGKKISNIKEWDTIDIQYWSAWEVYFNAHAYSNLVSFLKK